MAQLVFLPGHRHRWGGRATSKPTSWWWLAYSMCEGRKTQAIHPKNRIATYTVTRSKIVGACISDCLPSCAPARHLLPEPANSQRTWNVPACTWRVSGLKAATLRKSLEYTAFGRATKESTNTADEASPPLLKLNVVVPCLANEGVVGICDAIILLFTSKGICFWWVDVFFFIAISSKNKPLNTKGLLR